MLLERIRTFLDVELDITYSVSGKKRSGHLAVPAPLRRIKSDLGLARRCHFMLDHSLLQQGVAKPEYGPQGEKYQ
jgi:hypothetical protein